MRFCSLLDISGLKVLIIGLEGRFGAHEYVERVGGGEESEYIGAGLEGLICRVCYYLWKSIRL